MKADGSFKKKIAIIIIQWNTVLHILFALQDNLLDILKKKNTYRILKQFSCVKLKESETEK